MHIGRRFIGTEIENDCPCPQAPCGLVSERQADPACTDHHPNHAPTIRQGHADSACPGPKRTPQNPPARLHMASTRAHTTPSRKDQL